MRSRPQLGAACGLGLPGEKSQLTRRKGYHCPRCRGWKTGGEPVNSSSIAEVVDRLAQLQLSGARWQILAAIYGSQLRQGSGSSLTLLCENSPVSICLTPLIPLKRMAREIKVARPGVALRKRTARKAKHCATCGSYAKEVDKRR